MAASATELAWIAADGDFSSSEEEHYEQSDSSPGFRAVLGPMLFATTLVCGLLGTAYVGLQNNSQASLTGIPSGPNPYLAQVPAGELTVLGEHDDMLLESRELLDTSVEQALAFHTEFDKDDELKSLSAEERAQLKVELREAAQKTVQDVVARFTAKDPEAARLLQHAQAMPEHWKQTHKVLSALHDHRTQQLGQTIMGAMHDAHGDSEQARALVDERLQGHDEEIRALRDELIPHELHTKLDGPHSWEIDVSAEGVEASTNVQGWDASVEVSSPIRDLGVSPNRRLFTVSEIVPKIVGTLGVVVTTILSIITTAMTLISTASGARLFWAGQGVVDGGVCIAALGAMTPWTHWLPCMIASFFFGIEAIWTWMKH